MKSILMVCGILGLTVLFGNKAFALNAIDSINTDEDVFVFIKKFVPNYYDKEMSKTYYLDTQQQHVAESLNVHKWTKVDIDDNGETDLICLYPYRGGRLFIILCDNGVFIKKEVNKFCSLSNYFPVPILVNNRHFLLLYKNRRNYDNQTEEFTYTDLACDTLVIKNNQVFNYTSAPMKYNIEKIVFSNNGMCEGDCPIISVNIDARTLEYKCNKYYFNPNLGTYTGVFKKDTLQRIISLLQYSNFSKLKDSYRASCYDLPTTTLTITYNNGQTKTISDYGSVGNFTLEAIYDLAYNPTWVEDKKSSP